MVWMVDGFVYGGGVLDVELGVDEKEVGVEWGEDMIEEDDVRMNRLEDDGEVWFEIEWDVGDELVGGVVCNKVLYFLGIIPV